MKALLPLIFCFATPVVADPLNRQTLEEPGRIWLRDTLSLSAGAGLTIPFMSYVKFEDGTFEDVFATLSHVITPPSCADIFACEDAVSAAPIFTGQYDITDNGLDLKRLTRSPLNFDRPDLAIAMVADSFTRGEARPVLSFANGALERTTPNGPIRYVAAQDHDVREILGLAAVLEVSIATNFDCLVKGHLARSNAANPDKLTDALLAMAELGAIQIDSQDARHQILRGGTITMFDLPEPEQDLARQIQMADMMLGFVSSDMQTTYTAARASDENAPFPDLDKALDSLPPALLENIPEENQDAFLAVLKDQAALAQRALPALYADKNSTQPRYEPLDLLCYGL